MQCIKYFYWSDLSIQGQFYKMIWNSKSLAQVWICSKGCYALLESQSWRKIKVWQSWSNSRLKWLKCGSYLILSVGTLYYQEGCNIDWLTRSKVLIGHPEWESWEKTPINQLCATWMIECWLGEPSGALKPGFGLLWPRLVWLVWGTGLTDLGSNG